MSLYNPEVKIALDELCSLKTAVDCLSIVREERKALEKKNAELVKECETQAMEIGQLRVSIMEAEKELAAWKQAANADKPEADALAYIEEHNTPFEGNDVDRACEVIRALLKKKVDAPVGSDNAEGLS